MVFAILAVVLFGVLAVLNERIGRVMVADALKPTARPVAPVGGSVGHPGPSWDVYRTYAASSPTVRTYGRKHLDAGALAAPGGPPAAIEIEHRQPHRAPDMTADVTVPLTQAIATAVIVALLAGILGLLAGRSDAAKLAAGAFVVTLAAAWLWRLGVVSALLTTVETITRTDLDGDGRVGAPDETGHTMLVDPGKAREKAAKSSRHREQATQLADFLAFWRQCSTAGTSERAHGIKPGTPGQVAFRAKRDTLMRLGLAKWKDDGNHNGGWTLTTNEADALDILREHVRNLT